MLVKIVLERVVLFLRKQIARGVTHLRAGAQLRGPEQEPDLLIPTLVGQEPRGVGHSPHGARQSGPLAILFRTPERVA